MEAATIVAEIREKPGKSSCRKIREKGRTPAIFYGPDTPPVLLSIDSRDLEKILSSPKGANTVIELNFINSKDQSQSQKMAILKDWQVHPVRRTWLHADLYEISVNRPIVVNVPLQFTGKAKAVELGGILEEVRREISIECLPNMIPQFIEVDVSDMDFGQSIHVLDLRLGEGIKVVDDPDLTLVTIMAPKEEEVTPRAEDVEEVENSTDKIQKDAE